MGRSRGQSLKDTIYSTSKGRNETRIADGWISSMADAQKQQ